MFTLELLQAINDWQRGGDSKQKKKRGEKLRRVSSGLPAKFRLRKRCYRQIALDGHSVWQVGTQYSLKETMSAWTESEDVAREFKGGVPPSGSSVATLKPAICGQAKPAISNNARTQFFTPLLADEASTF